MRTTNRKWSLMAILLWAFSLLPVCAQQYMYLWQNGSYTRYDRSTLGEMPFRTNGQYITIGGQVYRVTDIDSLTFAAPVLDLANKVVVRYDGNKASVEVPAGVQGVTWSTDGAHVTLMSNNVTDELEYVLMGQTTDGSLLYNGDYKCKFYLNGLNMISTRGAAIDLQCGKRIELILPEGTENFLQDCAGGVQKAALNCQGHLEVEQGGHLKVVGRTAHAIRTNEYMLVKKSAGMLEVTGAANDGIHCGQYFMMNGGTVKVSGQAGDAVQAELTNNMNDEYNGELQIKGGILDLEVAGLDVKGLKSDKNLTISGGDIRIRVSGNGSKGISTDGYMYVNEATAPAKIDILATGGPYTDPTTGEVKKCMGIKVDMHMEVSAGYIKVVNTGEQSTGIKVAGNYKKTGGTVEAQVEAGAVIQ